MPEPKLLMLFSELVIETSVAAVLSRMGGQVDINMKKIMALPDDAKVGRVLATYDDTTGLLTLSVKDPKGVLKGI